MTNQVPPGWYADPYQVQGLLRWWDGSRWTSETLKVPDSAPGSAGKAQQPEIAQPQDPVVSAWQSPYAQPARPPRKCWPYIAGASGAAAVVAVVLVVVLLGFVGSPGNSEDESRPAAGPTSSGSPSRQVASPAAATTQPPARGSQQRTQSPRIKDEKAGISYRTLQAWRRANGDYLKSMSFSAGFVRAVPRKAGNKNSAYLANCLSRKLPKKYDYKRPRDLKRVSQSVLQSLGRYYPKQRTQRNASVRSLNVDGHQALLRRVTYRYPKASKQQWEFKKETVALLLVHRKGKQRPAMLWLSVPSNLQKQAPSIQQVVSSVRVS